ncbi:MAG: hypothetical protein LKI84_09830 [Lactococcus lactis]|jgi:hypothetical protein|nr:hypothetical protein [Lactococcus lactis]
MNNINKIKGAPPFPKDLMQTISNRNNLLIKALDYTPTETRILEEQRKANILHEKQQDILTQIAENTAPIKDMVNLMQTSNLKQEEMSLLLAGIFDIGASRSQEEAEGKFKKIISKISESGEIAGNVTTLVGMAVNVYDTVKQFIN